MTDQQFYSDPVRLDAPRHTHWSESVEWRPGRWDPMSSAPASTREIRGRDAQGRILEPMHFASDRSGEDQPAFHGWFVPNGGGGYRGVQPVEWQPLRAKP